MKFAININKKLWVVEVVQQEDVEAAYPEDAETMVIVGAEDVTKCQFLTGFRI